MIRNKTRLILAAVSPQLDEHKLEVEQYKKEIEQYKAELNQLKNQFKKEKQKHNNKEFEFRK